MGDRKVTPIEWVVLMMTVGCFVWSCWDGITKGL